MRWISKLILVLRARRFAAHSPGGACAVLAAGCNASLSYLIESQIAAQGFAHKLIDSTQGADTAVFDGCSTVVIVRWIPREWIAPLWRFRNAGGRVIYFMDDDLMDPSATAELPKSYAKKIRVLATSRREFIESLCDEFWVGSGYLAKKYDRWSAKVLTPSPSMADVSPTGTVSLCYHGTASHQQEMEWLINVLRSVQGASRVTSFEIFGDHKVNRMFRDLPRVSVLHPMQWPNYLAYTGSITRDIALAPLLPNPFNAGRGPTKFFDFARMGAVGIYTDVEPYRGFIRDGIDGVLLPNDPSLWVRTILELAADEPRSKRMAQAARERALSMAWDRPAEMQRA